MTCGSTTRCRLGRSAILAFFPGAEREERNPVPWRRSIHLPGAGKTAAGHLDLATITAAIGGTANLQFE
jgi:hypothetical protein